MENELLHAIINNNPESLSELLKQGTSINFLGGKGYSPLHGACINGNESIVKLLLSNQADPELKSSDGGFTALHFAAAEGHLNIVRLLLEHGANPNSRDQWGNTPIFRAGNKEEIGKLIVKFGGDPFLENENGISPLNSPAMAFKYLKLENKEHEEINYRALVNKGDNILLAKCLDEKKGDIEAKNDQGKSPLYLAVESENIEAITLLINAGADINTQEKFGYTPLAIAVLRGKIDLVKLLIEKGAKTDVSLPHESTLTSLASKHPEVREYLKLHLK